MKKETIILCDSNICIYRTLALIEPPIRPRDLLDKVLTLIAELTNNNYACKIFITDIIHKELLNNEILFDEVFNFCVKKLHWKKHSYKIQILSRKAEKSINKFFDKRLLSKEILEKIKNCGRHIPRIDGFYLRYPEKLEQITIDKIRHLRPFDSQRKLKHRPKNLPEESDRILLAQAIELNNLFEQDVCIFSNDNDFLEFRSEILDEFGIKILSPDDSINLEDDCKPLARI